MKTKIITLLALAAFAACGYSQAPAPADPTLILPSDSQAKAAPVVIAQRIIAGINSLVAQDSALIETGIPAREAREIKDASGKVVRTIPAQPEIKAADIQAALGADNVAKIRAALAALKGE